MHMETVRANAAGVWSAGLGGQQTERFRRVTLTADDFASLTVADTAHDGGGRLVRLGLQAYALGIAWEFDPCFALSISRVDPLPHQLEAVYEHLLKLPSVRFLLARKSRLIRSQVEGLTDGHGNVDVLVRLIPTGHVTSWHLREPLRLLLCH